MTVEEIQEKFKSTMAESLNSAMELVGSQLSKKGELFEEYVILKNRINRLESENRKGVLSFSDYNVEYNKLMKDSLNFISNLKVRNLKSYIDGNDNLLNKENSRELKPDIYYRLMDNPILRYLIYIFAVIGFVLVILNTYYIVTNE